jgi:inosine-uridine nucleoside N-ribohydrolase
LIQVIVVEKHFLISEDGGVDDALAILLALNSPLELNVLGKVFAMISV